MIRLWRRDIALAVRSGGGFGLGLAFYLIVVALVPFAVGAGAGRLAAIAPGIAWLAALLACLLSLDRVFATDAEDGTLDLLACAPVPLEAVAAAKAAAHWTTTGLPLAMVAPPLALLLHLPPAGLPWLALSLAVGTPALSLIGAFGAALTVGVRRGGLLLSLLVLPLYVPVLIFGAEVARRGAEGLPLATPLALLGALTAGCAASLPFAAAAALRSNLR